MEIVMDGLNRVSIVTEAEMRMMIVMKLELVNRCRVQEEQRRNSNSGLNF